jgi:hypothetical protein
LVYPCQGTFSTTGYYFDLEADASGDVLIESLSTMSQGAGARDVSVYYKTGTTVGFESNYAAWTFIDSVNNFSPPTATDCPLPFAPLPADINICIPAGQRYGFYLSITSGTGSFEVDDSLTEGTVAATDGKLTLYAGKGTFGTGAFSGFLYNDKTMQGSIKYSCGCSTGMELNHRQSEVEIFPVPATDELNVKINFPVSDQSIVSICNMYGELMMQQNLGSKSSNEYFQINLSDLPSGIFSMTVSGNSAGARKIFIKQ